MRTEYDLDDYENSSSSTSVADWFRAQFKKGVIGGIDDENLSASAWDRKRKKLLCSLKPAERSDDLENLQQAPTLACLRQKAMLLNLGQNEPH